MPEGIGHLLHGSLNALLIGHVAGDRQALCAEGFALLRDSLELLDTAGKDCHIGSLLGERLGIGCTDAGGSSGDDGSTSCKIDLHGSSDPLFPIPSRG